MNKLWIAAGALLGVVACTQVLKKEPVQSLETEVIELTRDQREKFATIINMNGKLCAWVVEARRRGQSSSYYVECEERRDSISRVGYEVNLSTGKVLN